jgi:hypothetical protein
MDHQGHSAKIQRGGKHWIWYLLVLLVVEKIVQHIFVTIAFWRNIGGIRGTVTVSPDLLMIAGAMVAILFILALWGLLTKKKWAIDLLIGLAVFDILGEFIAQGRLDIVITVSFIVAILILIFALVYRSQTLKSR